jgi:hypothetical protein
MEVENTDLERRVLAHEILIVHMAESEPNFLDRLRALFTAVLPGGHDHFIDRREMT